MIAFHGNKSVKAKYLKRVRSHAKADEIVKGQYWENGRGCAVGCTLHGNRHKDYETELGIPEMLARLEDTIFEGLPVEEAKHFPAKFLKAPKVGADLSCVGWQFLHWLLTEEVAGRAHPLVSVAVAGCAKVIEPLMRGEKVDAESAAESARSAAWSAESAAESARSAESASDASYTRMANKLIEMMESASVKS